MILLKSFYFATIFVFQLPAASFEEVIGSEFVTVNTSNGAIRGKRENTLFHNTSYYSFKGIPYAKPPVDELRFKVPEPINPWHPKILDALKYQIACSQPNYLQRENFEQGEDCLHVNIFTPSVEPDAKLSVMFYIFGGKFCTDSNDDFMFGPDFLMEKNVVLVNVNYRLGIFGCLSLGTPEYSGNQGHKDQRLGLEWVVQNIGQFGGDNKTITLFGHSSGAASVHFHMLSPWSRDLFQRAIIMSGSALNAWSHVTFDNHLEIMFDFARQMNRTVNDYDDLLRFLKSVPGGELLNNTKPMASIWSPIIEGPNAKDPFLTKTPEQLMEIYQSDIDTMFGFIPNEMLYLCFDEANVTQVLEEANREIDLGLAFRDNPLKSDKEAYRLLTQEIRQYYLGPGVDINMNTLREYSDYMSDALMVYSVDKAAKLQANKSTGNTFYYRFTGDTHLNQVKNFYNLTKYWTLHADELCYIFRCNRPEVSYDNVTEGSVEYRLIENMTKLWTNFAKYGEPAPNDDPVRFEPLKDNYTYFVDINNNGLFRGFDPHGEHFRFWTNFERKYYDLLAKSGKQTESVDGN